jgi:hypothetical protein
MKGEEPMEGYKDLLQMGFSFFVAAYLLIVYNQTLQTLTRKMDELLTEVRHLNALLLSQTNRQTREGNPLDEPKQ